jgi:hypothetical protein
MSDDTLAVLGALHVDEGKLKGHVDEVVRASVEETLNGLLDAEADHICRAQRYERSADRVDGRGGLGISDTGISGFLSGPNRREAHAKAKT